MRLAGSTATNSNLVLVPQQILGETATQIRVKTDVVALLIHVAKRWLVGEDADDKFVAGLDLVEGTVRRMGNAAGKTQSQQSTKQNRGDFFHADSFRLMTFV